jgi:hypothetical protein
LVDSPHYLTKGKLYDVVQDMKAYVTVVNDYGGRTNLLVGRKKGNTGDIVQYQPWPLKRVK